MQMKQILASALAMSALFASTGAAFHDSEEPAKFAQPKQLMAGDKEMGAKRLFASPVLHDLDGDGTREMIIGDLFGRVTYCKRTQAGWGEELPIKDKDGTDIKFSNW